jgi:hypothetical protein
MLGGSEEILAEMSRTLVRRFAKSPAKARYRETAMRSFFPQAMVDGHQPLIDQMRNHPKDRHVLAGCGARVQRRLLGHVQSSGFSNGGGPSHGNRRTVSISEDSLAH